MAGKRVPIIADQDSPVFSIQTLNTANIAITVVNALASVRGPTDLAAAHATPAPPLVRAPAAHLSIRDHQDLRRFSA